MTLRTRPIGRTVDFCPICRSRHSFSLLLAEHYRYVLWVPRERQGHAWHELVCKNCGCRVERAASEREVEMMVDSRVAAERYEPKRLAIVEQRIETCRRLEEKRRESALKPEEREEMLKSAMYSFAKLYDEDAFERVPPGVMTVLALVSLALLAAGALAYFEIYNQILVVVLLAVITVLIAGILLSIVARSPRRKVRSWIARAAAPLNPTFEEIRQIRREMQARRLHAGFDMKLKKLMKRIAVERKRMGLA